MKSLFVAPVIAVGLLIGQGAPAQTPPSPKGEASPEQKMLPSTRTREEVRAECVEALRAGKGPTGECSPEPEPTKSTRTRAEVQAECTAALKAGKGPTGECSPEPELKK